MERLCYLDNLKVCLTVLVIMHHAGQAYGNGGDWAYTPSNPTEFMPWFWHFFSTNAAFFMGLYFLISGYFEIWDNEDRSRSIVLLELGRNAEVLHTLLPWSVEWDVQ